MKNEKKTVQVTAGMEAFIGFTGKSDGYRVYNDVPSTH